MRQFITSLMLTGLLPFLSYSQQVANGLPDSSITHPPINCVSCAGALWNYESNIEAFDNQYAETELMPYLFCFQSLCYRSRYMTASGFGMNLPNDASVTGILVHLSGYTTHPFSVHDSTLRLIKNYSMVGINVPDSTSWDVQDENRIYGTGMGLWGESWTPAEINDPGFGVFFKVYNSADSSPVFKLDVISITVYYSTPQGIFSQTSTPLEFTSFYNQNSGNIHVSLEPDEPGKNFRLEVIDLAGTILYTEDLPEVTRVESQIETLSFPSGIYFVRCSGKEKQYVSKLVIAH